MRRLLARGILICIVLPPISVLAAVSHHSFGTQFDASQPVALTGEVVRVEWVNPHVYLHLEVGERKGDRASWVIELGSPNALTRLGWWRDRIRPGDVLSVEAFMGRSQPGFAGAISIVLERTGERLPVGSPR